MLSINSLTHVYPNGTRALEDISLEIPRGMFGLLGPNGAGKSTLMRCAATLQVPTTGNQLRRHRRPGQPQRCARTLGYLPQDFGVYPRVSADDMLDHLAVLKGVGGRGANDARPSRRCCIRSTCGMSGRRRSPAFRAACASASASRRR